MRVIHYSTDNGEKEAVVFTDEADDPMDFVPDGEGFSVDCEIQAQFPWEFLPSDGGAYIRTRW